MARQRRWKGRLRTRGLHRKLPAGPERWQVLRLLDGAEVGEQSMLGMPGVLGQVPEQDQAYARIEVLLGEDPADELLQLKLQKPARSCLARRGWLSRDRHCGRGGLPLLVVSRWIFRASGVAGHLDVHGNTPPFACPDWRHSAMASW
jgi:hypothetical protein